MALLPPRYLMFWFPLVVLLAALGVHVAVGAVGWLSGRAGREATGRRAAYTLAAVAVVVWMLPGVVTSYAVQKDQFREGAAYVMAEQRGPATVLVVGEIGTKLLPPFVVEAVEYYFWLKGAPVEVMDGTRLDHATVEQIDDGEREPWLGVFTDVSQEQAGEMRSAGFQVAPFRGVTFVRAEGDSSAPGDRLARLLDLATALYPQMVATRAALDDGFRDEHTGANLLPEAASPEPDSGGEVLQPGAGGSVDAASGTLVLEPEGDQADVSLTTRRLQPGESYVLLFRADNASLSGRQMVYVTTQAADGRALETVPGWQGYEVRRGDGSERQGVAFTVPEGAAAVTVWFRAEGEGAARVREVELRPER
jgi:hypothetical protein